MWHGPVRMAELPDRIKILEWGANESDRGTFTVDAKSAEALKAQIEGEAWAKLVIDFDHQSEEGSGSFKESPRHHAGYGDLEVVEGDGVYLTGIEWTEAGKAYALDYKDVSPSVAVDKEKRIVGVTSVALVPNGALKGRTLFAALRNDSEVDQEKEEHDMDEKENKDPEKKGEGQETREETQSPEDAGGTPPPAEGENKEDLEAGEELKALKGQLEALTKALEEAKAEIEKLKEAAAKPPAPPVEATSPFKDDLAAMEKRMLVEFAVRDGKAVTLPESVLAKMTVAETKQHLAGLKPGAVPMGSVIPRGAGGGAAGASRETGGGMALVAKYQGQGMEFERAWRAARAERPELF